MPQQRSPAGVRAEANTEQIRQFVCQATRVTGRKFSPEERRARYGGGPSAKPLP